MLLSCSLGATAFYEPHFPLYEAVCCLRDLRRGRFPFSHVPPSPSPSSSVHLHLGARIFARHCRFYRCNRKWDGRTNGRTGTNSDRTNNEVLRCQPPNTKQRLWNASDGRGRIIEPASFRISIYSISKRTSRRGGPGLLLLLVVLDNEFRRPQWIEARKGFDGQREGTQENELSRVALQIL